MSRLALVAVLLGRAAGAFAIDLPELADVKWDGRQIIATPGAGQQAKTATIEILHSEGCPHRSVSANHLEVAGACHYLSGIYRYTYQPTTDNGAHQVAVGFSLVSGGASQHAFIVSIPLDQRLAIAR